jgi:uncharacterized protein (DUF1800 family)
VEHYARRLVEEKWQIKPVLREMLASRLFFSEWSYRAKIKSPATLVIGSLAAIGGRANMRFAHDQMRRMGQSLLEPPTVKGWDGEQAWINANTVIQRFNFGLTLSQVQSGSFVRKPQVQEWLEQHGLKTADAIVDHFTRLFLDGRVDKESRDKLVDYMNRNEKEEPAPFILSDKTFNTKVRGALHLMMAAPEFQLA